MIGIEREIVEPLLQLVQRERHRGTGGIGVLECPLPEYARLLRHERVGEVALVHQVVPIQAGQVDEIGFALVPTDDVVHPIREVVVARAQVHIGRGRRPSAPASAGDEDIVRAAVLRERDRAVGVHVLPAFLHEGLAGGKQVDQLIREGCEELDGGHLAGGTHAGLDQLVETGYRYAILEEGLFRLDMFDVIVLLGREAELLHLFVGPSPHAHHFAGVVRFRDGIAEHAKTLETPGVLISRVLGFAGGDPHDRVQPIKRVDVPRCRGRGIDEAEFAVLVHIGQDQHVAIEVVHRTRDQVTRIDRHGNGVRPFGIGVERLDAEVPRAETRHGIHEEPLRRLAVVATVEAGGDVMRRGADISATGSNRGNHPGQTAAVGVVPGQGNGQFSAVEDGVHGLNDGGGKLRIGLLPGKLGVKQQVHVRVGQYPFEFCPALFGRAPGFLDVDVANPLGIVMGFGDGPLPAQGPRTAVAVDAWRVRIRSPYLGAQKGERDCHGADADKTVKWHRGYPRLGKYGDCSYTKSLDEIWPEDKKIACPHHKIWGWEKTLPSRQCVSGVRDKSGITGDSLPGPSRLTGGRIQCIIQTSI